MMDLGKAGRGVGMKNDPSPTSLLDSVCSRHVGLANCASCFNYFLLTLGMDHFSSEETLQRKRNLNFNLVFSSVKGRIPIQFCLFFMKLINGF